jgi:hypothetical protein
MFPAARRRLRVQVVVRRGDDGEVRYVLTDTSQVRSREVPENPYLSESPQVRRIYDNRNPIRQPNENALCENALYAVGGGWPAGRFCSWAE